jgi:hypothetical protein
MDKGLRSPGATTVPRPPLDPLALSLRPGDPKGEVQRERRLPSPGNVVFAFVGSVVGRHYDGNVSSLLSALFLIIMAETEGFEPSIRLLTV